MARPRRHHPPSQREWELVHRPGQNKEKTNKQTNKAKIKIVRFRGDSSATAVFGGVVSASRRRMQQQVGVAAPLGQHRRRCVASSSSSSSSCRLVELLLDGEEGPAAVEPDAVLDQRFDVVEAQLVGVVAPPRPVVPLRRQQLPADALGVVAPRTVEAGVPVFHVIDSSTLVFILELNLT